MTVHVRVLGPLEVVGERGRAVGQDFPSKKARRLFEVLVLAGGQTVSKDALVEALWRRQLPKDPAATVETAVSLARRTLARVTDERIIVTDTGGYRIDAAVVRVDLGAVEAALTAAEAMDVEGRVALLSAALSGVRGRLLDDEFATDWLMPRRERVTRRVELAQLQLARSALEVGDASTAFAVAERAWTDADVVLEDAYDVGVAALVALGRRAEAAAVLASAEQRLAATGAVAGPALRTARARLRQPAGAPPTARGLRVQLDAADPVVPAVLPFLGRAGERAWVVEAAAHVAAGRGARWCHVDGARGMGASRFLEEAAAWTVDEMGTGAAVFLQCAAGDEPTPRLLEERLARAVARRVADADSLPGRPGHSTFVPIAEALDAAGPTVVLVDGIRHSDDASVATLRALVQTGGATSLLVVSCGGPAPVGAEGRRLGLLTADDLASLGDGDWTALTGGHPTVLAVAVRALRDGGVVDEAGASALQALLTAVDLDAAVVVRLVADNHHPLPMTDLVARSPFGHDTTSRIVTAALDAGLLSLDDELQLRFTSSLLSDYLRR